MEINNSLEENQNEDDKGPFLSSDVKAIFKKRKEEKNKKGMKKMNLKNLIPTEEQEINTENDENKINKEEDDNENDQMIIQNNLNNEDNIQLEKKAKKNYKTIFNLHKNYDINFNTKLNENIKQNQNNNIKYIIKEIFFLIMNIIAFVFFGLSFVNNSTNDIIYYYLIYPISKTSFIYLIINSIITSLLLLLIFVKIASRFHLFYMAIFYLIEFYIYHLTSNNTISINYFDKGNCHFFIYIIIMLHILGFFSILYYICNYFYLNGQLNKGESCAVGFLIDYWESERKIEKLEKYINLNLDQLITTKGYSHEENNINKKKNMRVIWSIIGIGLILVTIHFFLMIKKNDIFNCNFLEQEEYNITKPYGYCYMNKLTGYFEISNNNMDNCSKSFIKSNFKKEKFVDDLIQNYKNVKVSTNTKYFAFPLTNKKEFYLNEFNFDNNILANEVNSEIFDLEKYPNNKTEIILDMENEKNPKLKIDLKYNEELVKERKSKENTDSLFNNVIVVHFTGVSQFYFKFAMPKLYSFIENYKCKESDKENNMSMDSLQFGKYHSFNDNVFYNQFLMYYDSDINSMKEINTKIINNKNIVIHDHLKYFQENGFITGQAMDTCSDTIYDHQLKSSNNYWDHESISPFCSKILTSNNLCITEKPFYSYQIDYANQFWSKYKDSKKYFKFNFNSTNEKTGSLLSYLDEPLYDFFLQLKIKGQLENTAIFFLSEGGGAQSNIFYNFGKNSEKEINMKFGNFMILFDKKNNLKENELNNAIENRKKLVTPFDVFASLVHISTGNKINEIKLYLNKNNIGVSVFKQIDSSERDCKLYDGWMDKDFCYFHNN